MHKNSFSMYWQVATFLVGKSLALTLWNPWCLLQLLLGYSVKGVPGVGLLSPHFISVVSSDQTQLASWVSSWVTPLYQDKHTFLSASPAAMKQEEEAGTLPVCLRFYRGKQVPSSAVVSLTPSGVRDSNQSCSGYGRKGFVASLIPWVFLNCVFRAWQGIARHPSSEVNWFSFFLMCLILSPPVSSSASKPFCCQTVPLVVHMIHTTDLRPE